MIAATPFSDSSDSASPAPVRETGPSAVIATMYDERRSSASVSVRIERLSRSSRTIVVWSSRPSARRTFR